MEIHSTAIVSKKAKLDSDIQLGPYSIINDNVRIGRGSRIGAYCVIGNNTTIGEYCEIWTGAVIGSQPQDLKYKGENSFLEIGNRNIVREYCTFNLGTGDGGKTIIGNANLFMAYSHVAHDCRIGNNCVIANNGTLAGHVIVEDKTVIGGLAAVHQFVTIGKLSIIGGCSKVVQDIPPYSTCDGRPASIFGLNLVGLKRDGMDKEVIRQLSHAFKILFNSGLSMKHALEKLSKEGELCSEVSYLAGFIKNSSRGISHSCRSIRNTVK